MTTRSATGSEEDVGALFSDCFWEIKGFKHVVTRIDEGAKLTDGLMQLVAERAEIEYKYAKMLKGFSRKWEDAINKGPEYGSTELAMKALTIEANETADVHVDVRQKLVSSVIETIKHWKSSNYQKAFVKWKQTNAANDGFEKAQSPWAKRYIKVEKAKKAYHAASRNRDQFSRQLELYEQDPMATSDSVKKIKDKLSKSETESDKTRDKYKDRLQELDMANQQYINEMTVEFEKCQAMEKLRMEFFRNTLDEYLGYVDVTKDPRLVNSFQNIQFAISEISVEEDLKKYADQKGTGMAMNWPTFVDYNEVDNAINVGNLRIRDDDEDTGKAFNLYDNPPPAKSNPFNGFDEDSEWGDNTYQAQMTSTNEVKVMAMFEYVGAESDELTFKEGDIIIQLDEEDENGWCRGMLNGVEGLYPGSYVQRIK